MSEKTIKESFFLYVENDPPSRAVMRVVFEKALGTKNYAIFEDSVDFIQHIRQLGRIPDVILLDIHIAPLDGFEMLRQLRADPELRMARVLALTASVMNEEVENLRIHGFDGAIGKPLNLQKFPELLEHALRGNKVWFIS